MTATETPPATAPSVPTTPREIRPGDPAEAWHLLSSATTVVAVLCGWMVLQLLVLGGVAEQRAQHLLFSQYRTELAAATAPTSQLDYNNVQVASGAPVALLSIPAIGMTNCVVVNGTTAGDLLAGPGLLRDTVLPGQVGTSFLMGRGSTYGAPFRDIADLRSGDQIVVRNGQGRVTYVVEDVRRAGDPIPATPTGSAVGVLTLVSSAGSGFLSALQSSDAVYVDAVTQKALTAGPVDQSVPATELIMARDTSVLPTLVLLLAGLVAVALGATAARRRFRLALVWLVATPAVVALAWSVTDQVMRLLPNLM